MNEYICMHACGNTCTNAHNNIAYKIVLFYSILRTKKDVYTWSGVAQCTPTHINIHTPQQISFASDDFRCQSSPNHEWIISYALCVRASMCIKIWAFANAHESMEGLCCPRFAKRFACDSVLTGFLLLAYNKLNYTLRYQKIHTLRQDDCDCYC